MKQKQTFPPSWLKWKKRESEFSSAATESLWLICRLMSARIASSPIPS